LQNIVEVKNFEDLEKMRECAAIGFFSFHSIYFKLVVP